MRIDDENRVVWCSEELINRLREMPFFEANNISRLVFLSELSLGYDVPQKNDDDEWNKISKAVFDYYSFELEQPQKYYWRKKKEHLAWFEEDEIYLNLDDDTDGAFLSSKASDWSCETKFTKQEARDLLKDDFDKFEKVECE